MSKIITDSHAILRRRGRSWSVVAESDVLRFFLAPKGDYRAIADDPDALSTSDGGNEISWDLVDENTVELSHQHAPMPSVRVDRQVLLGVIAALKKTRSGNAPAKRRDAESGRPTKGSKAEGSKTSAAKPKRQPRGRRGAQ